MVVKRVIHLVLGLLFLPVVGVLVYHIFMLWYGQISSNVFAWLTIGGLCCLFGSIVVARSRWRTMLKFSHVFEHLLAHFVVARLFGNEVIRIRVDQPYPGGGYIGEVHYRDRSNFTVSLAPYYLPLLALPFIVVYPFLPSVLAPIASITVGFMLAFHYIGLSQELHLYQNDIRSQGILFSLVVIIALNAIYLHTILCLLTQQFWNLVAPVTATVDTFAAYLGLG